MNTALMVFSLSSSKETGRKSLGSHNKELSNNFFETLIGHTDKIASQSGVDVIWIDGSLQRGKGFSERFTNAFEDVFAMGYENVLAIGNDCPDLTTERLKIAVDKLQSKKLVLGPATDGGVYLIGCHRSFFKCSDFQNLPWLQNSLFDNLLKKAEQFGIDFFRLDPLSDIDDSLDIAKFISRKPHVLLAKLCKKLLFSIRTVHVYEILHFLPIFPKCNHALRAPPCQV